jgi:DNA-binding MarR family transcriptional regulator
MKRSARDPTPAGDAGTEPDSAVLEVADRLHSAAIHLLRRLRREDPATGIPSPQLSALSVIVFRGPLTLGALAAAEQVRPPSMTRIVRALEQAGLVERETDARDRRSVWIRPTALGETVLQQGRLRRVRALAVEIASLSNEERSALDRALAVIEKITGPRQSRVRTPDKTD